MSRMNFEQFCVMNMFDEYIATNFLYYICATKIDIEDVEHLKNYINKERTFTEWQAITDGFKDIVDVVKNTYK